MNGLAAIRTAQAGLTAFVEWWLGELKSLLPQRWIGAAKRRRVEILCAKDGFRPPENELLSAPGEAQPPYSRIAEAIKAAGPGAGSEVIVRIVLDEALCLVRASRVPRAARNRAGQILALQIERTTPFRSDELISGWRFAEDDSGATQLRLTHVLVKRTQIASILEALRGLRVQRIEALCRLADGSDVPVPLPRDLQIKPSLVARWLSLADRIGILALAAGIAFGIWVAFARQQETLLVLERRIEAAQVRAVAVGEKYERAKAVIEQARLLGEKGYRASVAAIVEEVARLLPDGAWLTDLEIDGNAISLIGFARSAPALIGLLDSSELFEDVEFGAPVVRAPREDADRFIITLTAARAVRPAAETSD